MLNTDNLILGNEVQNLEVSNIFLQKMSAHFTRRVANKFRSGIFLPGIHIHILA